MAELLQKKGAVHALRRDGRECGGFFAKFMRYVRTEFDSKQLNEETDLVQGAKLVGKSTSLGGAGAAETETGFGEKSGWQVPLCIAH